MIKYCRRSIQLQYLCRQIAILWLRTLRKQCTYCIIVSTLQFNCSIDVTVDDLDRFDLFFLLLFFFEADNLPSRKLCFLTSRKLVFAISFPFRLILFIFLVFKLIVILFSVKARGGVEETRVEAKAKDTKKIRGQGQGQPFRGQTLSRPRTGMLEAKAKDQEHKRKCSTKKKVFTKIFQAISSKKRFLKNFSSAPQSFNNSKNTAVLKPRTGQFSRT